ncbi:pyruvate kinase [Stappia taiwanensis]|uniref:Pyruvate kinase n=1 Tax=Stappia taiwanensis TaxID=992267 RepID=A0A838XTI2_9HYPH|nr:pyruvate kinase [Stappia taiwanensis]MBA4612341.1 pyruvate kinase [Stappia taiwanensis]GGF04637.1 pyruvate kinase [Stappia taiwanensis]
MKRDRRVKIVATLGPSSSDPETIRKLFQAGADVFRINMSHADHARLNTLVDTIRTVEAGANRPIAILADLQGPKLRVGTFESEAVVLENDATFILDSDPTPGNVNRVNLPHREILEALEPGHRLLLDDGKIRLRVVECIATRATTVVEVGGRLSNRKGVSVPDTEIPVGALTPKDHKDLEAALEAKVDWIALSFIQRPDDLAEVRKVTRGRAGILAKIEKPQAIERLGEIIDLSDALMVARGDLGVEMPLEQVPGLQKQIVRACRRAGKPVVVATQMLESMITSPVPTRAEVSDVATAVFEGADAVMLSAESAAGEFPLEAVSTMDRIARQVERDPNYRSIIHGQRQEPEATGADAISAAARQIAETLNLAAVVCYTTSGATGLRASRERPTVPVIVISPVTATARRLSLAWGLHCVVSDDARDESDMVDRACRISFQEGIAKPGQRIITTAGVPFGTPGSTNMLRISFVGSDGRGGL